MASESIERVPVRMGVQGVLRHARPHTRVFVMILILGLVSAVANGSVPYITGKFFDALIALSNGETTTGSIAPWMWFLGVWALIQFVASSIDWGMDRLNRNVDTAIHLSVQTEGFIHLLKLPVSFHTNEHINGILSRLSTAAWRIAALMRSLITFLPQLLSVVIGLALAARINVMLAGILAAGVVLYLLLLIRTLRPIAAADEIAQRVWNDAWNDAAEAVHQVTTVKQAAAEAHEIEKIHETLTKRAYTLWQRVEHVWGNISFFQRIVVLFTQLIVFFLSVYMVAAGTLTVGELIALNGYALMFFGPFAALAHNWQTIQNGLTSAGQLEVIFERKEEAYTSADARTPEAADGRVSFDAATLRYEESSENVLKGISLSIPPGETVALVGESGAGKSSLISLISAYHFPNEGSVQIDGIDTREWDLTDLRKRIAVVPQEIALFNDSVRANIRYGSFDATDEQIEEAAKKAHIHEFIQGLPQKYDSLVGERGVKLSVGQKQRVAIARAILRNPEILILDEPTSALDPETERYITTSLEELMRGRTTFIIAHRLSTVRKADRILVLKGGHIIEEGNHEELRAREGGEYRRLYEMHIGLHE